MPPKKLDWKSFLASLDLFFRERLLKVTHLVSSVKEQAADDEIIRTMLGNKETQPFADQRVSELIKEALSVEQEVAIEGLKKQALALQGQKEIALAQKEAI